VKRFLVLLNLTFVPILVLAADTAQPQSAPTSPFGIGSLVGWVVCARRKREAIGGWLMYYYWILYAGMIFTAVMLPVRLQDYTPQNFDDRSLFLESMCSVVPPLVLLALQAAVATFLLVIRNIEMLRLLRYTLMAALAASLVGSVLSSMYFPEQLPIHISAVISNAIWLAYLFVSQRVKHVFVLNDWDVAVQTIHPSQGPLKVVS